jgi:hypothetical protein
VRSPQHLADFFADPADQSCGRLTWLMSVCWWRCSAGDALKIGGVGGVLERVNPSDSHNPVTKSCEVTPGRKKKTSSMRCW